MNTREDPRKIEGPPEKALVKVPWIKIFTINFMESFTFAKLRPWFFNILAAPFFIVPSLYFTWLLLTLNQRALESGFLAALRWGLGRYYGPTLVHGTKPPQSGPLLVVANHPGLGDFPALMDAIGRDDVRVIVKKRRLMEDLGGILQNCIIIDQGLESRAKAILKAVDHLASGGCLMVFPAGEIEEDPSLSLGGSNQDFLKPWFPIVDGILKRYQKKHQGLFIQGALIHHVYHVPRCFLTALMGIKEMATRSGRAALITMALPRQRGKSVEVSFLEPGPLPSPGDLGGISITETLRRALLKTAQEVHGKQGLG